MRRAGTRSRRIALVAGGVVLAGAGTTYAVAERPADPDYRTVAATRGDVEETLTLAGLVDAAHRADLSFGTDGTVSSVKVAQGERVRAGQVIAVLETEELDAAVTRAEADLARAKAQLESDQEQQSAAVRDAVAPTSPQAPQQHGPDKATQALLKKLTEQQRTVLDAQKGASSAIATANAALATQTEVCAQAYGNAAEGADPEEAPEQIPDQDAACDAALGAVQAAQAAVKTAQDALARALDDLSATLTKALGTLATDQQQARTNENPVADDTSSTDTSSGAPTVTAAQLAADQAEIDQAEADLISAQADRAQAVLRSTRAGRVVSLDLAKGDAVSAGTAVAVVVGGTAVTLTVTVPETRVGELEVGQQAKVNVPGSATSTEGTVTAIGMNADTSTGTTSYPVTVTVEDPAIALPTGSRAQVSIVLATAQDVLTVPISAVTRTGDAATVRVWDGKALERTRVTLGAVGSRTVAVTDGLEEGDEVVLADVDQKISGASDQVNRGGFGPGGGGPPVVFRQGGPGGTRGGPVTFGSR